MKKLILTIILCVFFIVSFGNKVPTPAKTIAELLNEVSSQPDSVQVLTYQQIGESYLTTNFDSAVIFFEKSITLAQKNELLIKEVVLCQKIGNEYLNHNVQYMQALHYFYKALSIHEKNPNLDLNSIALQNKLEIYRSIANAFEIKNFVLNENDSLSIKKALEYSLNALKIAKKLNNKNELAHIANSIGGEYLALNNNSEALKYYLQSLKLKETIGAKEDMGYLLSNIGIVYTNMGNFSKAIHFHNKALKLMQEQNLEEQVATTFWNIGNVYMKKQLPDSALIYFKQSLTKLENVNKIYSVIGIRQRIATAYIAKKEYKKAIEYLLETLLKAQEKNFFSAIIEIEYELSDLYSKLNDEHKAFEHFKKYVIAKEKQDLETNSKNIFEYEKNLQFEKQQAEQQQQESSIRDELKQQKNIRNYTILGLLFFLLLSAFIYIAYALKKTKTKALEIQNQAIEERNKDITDSIDYARIIQKAMLPHRKHIWEAFPESFVLLKPKDIVSGDFYYFINPTPQTSDSFIIAAADCTGHGVPGALISMLSIEKLNAAVSKSIIPSEILSNVNNGIKTSLKQFDSEKSTREGMDIALLKIDLNKTNGQTHSANLMFSGANRPLWIIRKNTNNIEEIKGTRKGIGGHTDVNQVYKNHELLLEKDDTVYIFSDGYADLFNPNGEKLMTSRFKELLLSVQHLSLNEQGKHLNEFANNWKAGKEQIDDILVIGIKI